MSNEHSLLMQNLIDEFEAIASELFLREFLQKYGFRLADSRSHADQYVLGAFIGQIEGRQARIVHRVIDNNSAGAAGPHKNQVTLELDGTPLREVGFCGNY